MSKTRKAKPINTQIIPEAKFSVDINNNMTLDLPYVGENDLPGVSVLTVTKNRKKYFRLPIYQWQRYLYPKHKLEWIIIDDSDNGDELTDILPNDARIKYFRVENMNVGDKRNLAVERAQYDYLVHMDDDDIYFQDSILAKVRILLKYNKACVYSHTLGIYDSVKNMSAIYEDYKDVPEASMMYTREFWKTRRFNKTTPTSYEAYNLVRKREKQMIKVQFWFNMIACTHSNNLTGRLRSIKGNKDAPNFYDIIFDTEQRRIIKLWHKNNI